MMNDDSITLFIRSENISRENSYAFTIKIIFSLFPLSKYSLIIDHHYLSWFSINSARKMSEELNAKYLLYKKTFFRCSGTPINSFSMELKSSDDLKQFLKIFGKDTDDIYLRILSKTQDITPFFNKSIKEGEEIYKELLNTNVEYQAILFLSCIPLDIIVISDKIDFTNSIDMVKDTATIMNIELDEINLF